MVAAVKTGPIEPSILLEDNHCLVVNKPAGMLSQGDATGDATLVDWVGAYWKRKYAKPGNVYVGLVHRLDRPTSGVVLLARTSKAASRLSEQFRQGRVSKTYYAICEGTTSFREGIWEDQLSKDQQTNTVSANLRKNQGQTARVRYEIIDQKQYQLGVILEPLTGRGHQLRVQLASRGLPIVGDQKYGAKSKLLAADGLFRIALHAARIRFNHPTKGEIYEVEAPLPSDWPAVAIDFARNSRDSNRPMEHLDHSKPRL